MTGMNVRPWTLLMLYSPLHYCKAVKAEGKPVREPVVRTRRETLGLFIPFIIFVLILVYAVLFIQIGFIPATVIVPPVILFAVGCRKWS